MLLKKTRTYCDCHVCMDSGCQKIQRPKPIVFE